MKLVFFFLWMTTSNASKKSIWLAFICNMLCNAYLPVNRHDRYAYCIIFDSSTYISYKDKKKFVDFQFHTAFLWKRSEIYSVNKNAKQNSNKQPTSENLILFLKSKKKRRNMSKRILNEQNKIFTKQINHK